MQKLKHLKNDYLQLGNLIYKPYTVCDLPANFGCINFGEKEGLGHFSRIYNLYKNLNKKYICKIVVDKRKKLFLKKNIKINNIYSKSEKFISELDDARKFANSISKNIV